MKRKMKLSSDELRDAAYQLLELTGSLFEVKEYSKDQAERLNVERLYHVSKSFGMAALADYALRRVGCKSIIFDNALEKSQRRSLLYDVECQTILKRLAKAEIYGCPLKGMVIKQIYPILGLREMIDMDIFVCGDRERVRDLMIGLGYQVKIYGESNHDVYVKPPMFCVELHHQLIDGEAFPSAVKYYDDYAARLITDANGIYLLSQTKEDFYVYMLAHMYKHYTLTGIGVRALTDVAVYCRRYKHSIDTLYIERELEQLGIHEFEQQVRDLTKHIFDPRSLSPKEKSFLDDFILCGAYGSKERYYRNIVNKKVHSAQKSSKWKYIKGRLRVPKKAYQKYPVLSKHRILVPPYAVYRFGKAVFDKNHNALKELKTVVEYHDGE